ncbi:hypothetical protein SCA6_010336 [Theobroma cacao]
MRAEEYFDPKFYYSIRVLEQILLPLKSEGTQLFWKRLHFRSQVLSLSATESTPKPHVNRLR